MNQRPAGQQGQQQLRKPLWGKAFGLLVFLLAFCWPSLFQLEDQQEDINEKKPKKRTRKQCYISNAATKTLEKVKPKL